VTGIEPALPAWEVASSGGQLPVLWLTCTFSALCPLATVRNRDRPF
jgi:hypothetical protein